MDTSYTTEPTGPTLRIIGSTGKDKSPYYIKVRVKGQIHPFQRVF